jgi:hypothetical protein
VPVLRELEERPTIFDRRKAKSGQVNGNNAMVLDEERKNFNPRAR